VGKTKELIDMLLNFSISGLRKHASIFCLNLVKKIKNKVG